MVMSTCTKFISSESLHASRNQFFQFFSSSTEKGQIRKFAEENKCTPLHRKTGTLANFSIRQTVWFPL